MTTPYTVDLESGAWPSDKVGGKAEGLRRLAEADLRIAPGFCVTTDAFEAVVTRCVAGADSLAELRRAIRQAELPDTLEAEIRRQLARRGPSAGEGRWAVRSSAVEEDSEAMSFAGQQHTELGVEGPEAVLEAIRRVWAGLYDIDSLLYRSRLRVDGMPRPMAVVVQAMVTDIRAGGVMFTRDPLAAGGSERAESAVEPLEEVDQLLITASSESAEAVVRGSAGVSYWVDRASGAVRRENADEQGTLSAQQIEELTERARTIERAFGGPQDIEWVIGRLEEETRLYFLQSRPITAAEKSEETGKTRYGGTPEVWTNANVGEALPGVATPLTWSIIGKFSRRGFERAFGSLGLDVPEDFELVGSFRGRVYLNLTQFVSIAGSIPILKPDVLHEMGGGGGIDVVRDVPPAFPPSKFLSRLPVTIPRIILSQLAMPLLAPRWSDYMDEQVDAFLGRDLAGYTEGALAAELGRIDRIFDRNGLITLTCSSNFLMSYVVMKRVLEWFGDPAVQRRERDLVGALEVQSAEPGIDLLKLTRLARRSEHIQKALRKLAPDEVLAELQKERAEGEDDGEKEKATLRRFLRAFEEFRKAHGHRAPREAELATPRWREESRFVFEILERYLEADDLPTADQHRRRLRERRQQLQELVDEGFGPVIRPLFRLLLSWARMAARIREYMRSHVVETLDLYRQFALECGRRLREMGVIGQVEDAFYLRYQELRDWLGGAPGVGQFRLRVMVRRAVVEALREMPDPPGSFVLRDGDMVAEEEFRRQSEAERGIEDVEGREIREVIRGLPGSRGRVTGTARVIEHPDEDQPLRPGEVLVAPYTDVGWTPLFLTASAVVMGLGGPLSHACIVAREFGVPTVVNAKGATEVIETGDLVTVDADEGVVYVHEADSD